MSQVTKKALAAALKDQLLKKPLHKITINDITEECGINRMTFYYHFKDIYDLVEWTCVEDAVRALEGNKTYDTWQQGFYNIFEAVLQNKPFIMNVYHSVSREQVENYLYHMTYGLLIGVVEERAEGLNVGEEEKKFIADFYKYAFVGIMLNWIKNDMKEDPKDIIDKVLRKFKAGERTPGFYSFPKYKNYPKERNTETYISSAYFKWHYSWAKFKAYFKSMIKSEPYIVCGFPYQLPVSAGYYPMEQIREEMQEDDFNEISWSINLSVLLKLAELKQKRCAVGAK